MAWLFVMRNASTSKQTEQTAASVVICAPTNRFVKMQSVRIARSDILDQWTNVLTQAMIPIK
jgi:hypothetical protein